MTSLQIRPESSEYDPFFATYVDRVPDGDILSTLATGVEETLALLRSCPTDWEQHAYAPGKWSVRQLVGHVIDAERLYAFRALQFARRDPAPLPGIDPNVWAASSNSSDRQLSLLRDELATVRAATLGLFSSFDDATMQATGIAGGRRFSVRSLAWVIAGHEIHHRRMLEERYFAGALSCS